MQLLIVHRDAALGEQLVQMVKDYTAHGCDLVATDAAAIEWSHRNKKCALLLTQVQGDGVDGLSLGGKLGEIFPGLQTLFLPSYGAAERRLEVEGTKAFPEPIDGEGLLGMIASAEKAIAGAPDLFHVVDVLQMCCLSKRSGAIQFVNGGRSGIVFLHGGQIVHAKTLAAHGREALQEMVAWEFVEFAYDAGMRSSVETIPEPWDSTLLEAVSHQNERISPDDLRRRA